MRLFERIPERFFSILASSKKELYLDALFVLRQAFKTELVIRRTDLAAMLIDTLETGMLQADFTEEEEELEEGQSASADFSLSGKAYLLIRKLKETGWLDVEYESNSFEEHITIPDYAIAMMNLLYDLSSEQVKEYNSYVFATYAALKNTEENPDYYYQALQAAYQNTVHLVDELKLLFNNIRRYYQRITAELGVNELLAEHFDRYKEQIVDTIYYPLKTIDSVPRFKHSILTCLNEWMFSSDRVDTIIAQGRKRHIYSSDEEGREDILSKINYISDTYENIEGMIEDIDKKHVEYTNASIDRIRYMINADRSVKGKLVELLKYAGREELYHRMQESLVMYRHTYLDSNSLYDRVKRTIKTEGKPLAIEEAILDSSVVEGFLAGVRKQYSTRKIDDFIERCFNGKMEFTTEDLPMESSEEFILFLLGTIRGSEKSASYRVKFIEGNVKRNGYQLPKTIFQRKGRGQ
ncbi:MAG: DUF5716 family protein [Clostridium sp.]